MTDRPLSCSWKRLATIGFPSASSTGEAIRNIASPLLRAGTGWPAISDVCKLRNNLLSGVSAGMRETLDMNNHGFRTTSYTSMVSEVV